MIDATTMTMTMTMTVDYEIFDDDDDDEIDDCRSWSTRRYWGGTAS